MTLRERTHWFALHGVIRGLASFGAKRGEVQGRLDRRPDGAGRSRWLRRRTAGKGHDLVRGRAAWLTADHALAHQLLRSDDFARHRDRQDAAEVRWAGSSERTDRQGPAASAAAAVAAVGRTARAHPLPQAGVVGVHHQSRCRAAGSGAGGRERR